MTYVREDFHSVTPYLINKGAEKLIDFMKQAFAAEERFRMPAPEGGIMHAEVRIGDSILELSDGSEQYPPMPTSLHLYAPGADAVYQRALEAGATSLYAPVDQDYGDREAGITDPIGNHWYISTHAQRPGHYRPEGLYDVTPYLHAKGAAGLIRFMEEVFGAKEIFRLPNPDGTLAHAKVQLGDSVIETGDAHDQWQPMPASLHIYVPDADAIYARALAAGATSVHPVIDQPYGERSGGVQDAWGNKWWIATYTGAT